MKCVGLGERELAAGKNTCGTIILMKLWCHRYFCKLELVFVNSFYFSIIKKNKLIVLIVLLLLSLMSFYMPHGLAQVYEHHDYESSVEHVINDNKPAGKLRKLLKRLRTFLHKLIRLPQILSNPALATIRLVIFSMRFFKVCIVHLFSFLFFYFHGSKYKHSINHSDLLPSMAV